MAVVVKSKSGKNVTLLNPAEKDKKYAAELKAKVRCTNDHHIKRDKNGKKLGLSKAQRAYRAGYLTARSDSAKAYNSNRKKRKSR